jgi:SAM-dependent methyltransferase
MGLVNRVVPAGNGRSNRRTATGSWFTPAGRAGHNARVASEQAAGASHGPGREPDDRAAAVRAEFPDFRFAPNIGGHPDVYEIENQALDRAGHLLAAMRALAPWDGRTIVDLGCGTGYWLPRYATDARQVIGIEPDPDLRARAARRVSGIAAAQVVSGSAEHTGLPDRSAEVIHARFAYFFGPGADAGLTEALRVLRPGGSLVVADNDHRWGEFAELLAAASAQPPRRTAAAVDRWWRERGATRHEVRSEWRFASRADLDAVLRIEFPGRVADSWLARHPAATGLTYGYVLFAVTAASP